MQQHLTDDDTTFSFQIPSPFLYGYANYVYKDRPAVNQAWSEDRVIVEMRTYMLKPGSVTSWLRLYEMKGLDIHKRTLGNLLGYFYTEIGNINQIVHLWGYESFEDRTRRRAELSTNDEWRSFLDSAMPLLESQTVSLLNCAPFSPIR